MLIRPKWSVDFKSKVNTSANISCSPIDTPPDVIRTSMVGKISVIFFSKAVGLKYTRMIANLNKKLLKIFSENLEILVGTYSSITIPQSTASKSFSFNKVIKVILLLSLIFPNFSSLSGDWISLPVDRTPIFGRLGKMENVFDLRFIPSFHKFRQRVLWNDDWTVSIHR